MTIQLISLINRVQTIDGVDLDPFETQQRVGTTVTSEIATAVTLRKIQCDLLEGSRVKWADAEGTSLVKPTGASVEVGAGGSSEFTSLEDAPATITPNAVVAGNSDGTGLFMSENFVVSPENGVVEIKEDGDNGVTIHAHGSGGLLLSAGGTGGLVINGNGESGVMINSIGATAGGVVINAADTASIQINPGTLGQLQVDGNPTPQSQSVLVAGVGTMLFKHGILVSFTPA